MKHLSLAYTAVCLVMLFSCGKSVDLPQPNNIPVPPIIPVTKKIDTVITYTPTYYPWVGSQKIFVFPVLDGISNPVIDIYYKTATQTTWKELPDGFTAWFVRNGGIIGVYVRLVTTEVSVKIEAAW